MIAKGTIWSRCVWLFTIFSKRGQGVSFLSKWQNCTTCCKHEKGAILLNVFPGKLDSVQKANTLRFTTYPNHIWFIRSPKKEILGTLRGSIIYVQRLTDSSREDIK